MENVIKRIVKYILDSKYEDFEDVIVTKKQPTYADMDDDDIYYNVYCVIDEKKYFGGDLDWAVVRDSILKTIKMSGIKNNVNIYLRFSDSDSNKK
jgi:hypothetical protein